MIIIRKNEPFDIQIESAEPWAEKSRELFIDLLAEAIARYWSVSENREKIHAQIAEQSSEEHD